MTFAGGFAEANVAKPAALAHPGSLHTEHGLVC